MALGMGESKEVVRGQMIEKMIRGSGPPPKRDDE
jgi:Splicing factor 3B subunit 10 (SF3b10)